ncbi:hypothetical protein [Intrasporangium sp.]|jgi:hypothetical protein|uniref:hypothetical protein n=1 Tax=Intrasporangium sp. TaxID=1925024 RepID=UPI0033656345
MPVATGCALGSLIRLGYFGSAFADPSGGVHGVAGMDAARAALAHRRLGSVGRLACRRR